MNGKKINPKNIKIANETPVRTRLESKSISFAISLSVLLISSLLRKKMKRKDFIKKINKERPVVARIAKEIQSFLCRIILDIKNFSSNPTDGTMPIMLPKTKTNKLQVMVN